MNMLQSILDSSSHGIFTLDKKGIVTNINSRAKEVFGLNYHSSLCHEGGTIEEGDIVIIGDTALGADDGNLKPEELKLLGIDDKRIKEGTMFVAIAAYMDNSFKPVVKAMDPLDAESLKIESSFKGKNLKVKISDKKVTAYVDGVEYSIGYFLSIGQIVIIDGVTGKVKFWEEKGYSARKEGIGNILRGNKFAAKDENYEIDVVGYHFIDFFEGELFEKHLDEIISGTSKGYENVKYMINGKVVLASLLPIGEDEQVEGVIVRILAIEDFKSTLIHRSSVIHAAEESYKDSERSFNRSDLDAFEGVLGNGPVMAHIKRLAWKLSQLDCNILITGESGTGKSYLAKAIKEVQPRKGPFIKVDCSTITPTLFESEMFGYVAGAFTGANQKGKIGFFQEADGGTIFLDEIGEVPLNVQAKLLSAIQNKEISPVGSTKVIPVDVRILAATNRNLKQEVEAVSFRKDLYYRLSGFSIDLPPLRECKDDIYFIIENLLGVIKEKYGLEEKYLSNEAFRKLISYSYPGNIRELENILERAVALSDTDLIYPEQIKIEDEYETLTLKEQLQREEKRIIEMTLRQFQGNRMKAMDSLGISKTVFYGKLKEYGIK